VVMAVVYVGGYGCVSNASKCISIVSWKFECQFPSLLFGKLQDCVAYTMIVLRVPCRKGDLRNSY
jgi:hypothetical protein